MGRSSSPCCLGGAHDRGNVVSGCSCRLDSVNLEVPMRGLFGVVGPNGAGKSSLLKAAFGVLPLAEGEVLIAGKPLYTSAGPQPLGSERRRAVAAQRERDPRVVAGVLWVAGFDDPPPCDSVGRRLARATLACALVHSPELVLADEPAAHLDLPNQHDVMSMLREAASRQTIVVVLHDLHLACEYCEQVAVMEVGFRPWAPPVRRSRRPSWALRTDKRSNAPKPRAGCFSPALNRKSSRLRVQCRRQRVELNGRRSPPRCRRPSASLPPRVK